MRNLFSSFDPSALFGFSLNWLSGILFLVFIPARSLFLVASRRKQIWKILFSVLHLEFSRILSVKIKPGTTWFLISLFTFIFVNNVLGLFPYIFTAPSHLTFTLALALPLWLGHVILSWVKQPTYALAHLVPKGTPGALIRFIVLIELVRNIIRPLTLRVRLIANMTAGHLLLCLLRSNISILRPGVRVGVIAGLVLLVTLEIAVSLIQAYVFTLLFTLYLEEVQTKEIIWRVSI